MKVKDLLPLLNDSWVEITLRNITYYDINNCKEYTTTNLFCSKASELIGRYKDLDSIEITKIGSCQYKDGTCVNLDCTYI